MLEQEAGAFCAVNAVHNGESLGDSYVAIKTKCGPLAEIKEVRGFLDKVGRAPCKLRRTPATSRRGQLYWLSEQTTAGAFVVEFEVPCGLHVVTWIVAAGGAATIYETDLMYPRPLPVTKQVLEELGIGESTVKTVLGIQPSTKRRKAC